MNPKVGHLMDPNVQPSLRVLGLHIEGLKALRRVDWPADGMGWRGAVPDMAIVGGINGSGKTTLLEFIASAAKVLEGEGPFMWSNDPSVNAWIDFAITSVVTGEGRYRVVVGDRGFVSHHLTEQCTYFSRTPSGWRASHNGDLFETVQPLLGLPGRFIGSDLPRVLYFPTDRRFEMPDEPFKAAGDIEDREGFFYRFRPATQWAESLGALLYGARWADLNAKEDGHPEKATNFESYDRAFQAFFGDIKRLAWHEGKLFVQIKATGELHPLLELSSGEKQALILAAELYRHWRPGSLVLIDEPELHFHSSWQTTLWTMLEVWRRERGGQVIVATQSTHLFEIAAPGTTVLLGKGLV